MLGPRLAQDGLTRQCEFGAAVCLAGHEGGTSYASTALVAFHRLGFGEFRNPPSSNRTQSGNGGLQLHHQQLQNNLVIPEQQPTHALSLEFHHKNLEKLSGQWCL